MITIEDNGVETDGMESKSDEEMEKDTKKNNIEVAEAPEDLEQNE